MKKCPVLLFICCLSFFLVAAESLPDANLVKNADFSQMAGANPAGWICVVPANGLTIQADGDMKSLKLTKAGDGACMIVQRELPLAYDKTYYVSCEVKSGDQGTGMVYVEYRKALADGKYKHTSVHATPIHGTEEWTEILFEIGPRPQDCERPYIVLMSTMNSMEFRNLKLLELK